MAVVSFRLKIVGLIFFTSFSWSGYSRFIKRKRSSVMVRFLSLFRKVHEMM